jgi:hypothetical protein
MGEAARWRRPWVRDGGMSHLDEVRRVLVLDVEQIDLWIRTSVSDVRM